jgi:hypothetical protein
MLIPMAVLTILMLVRNIYIGLLFLYVVFCLPCYCCSDQCFFKRWLGVKQQGASQNVINYIDKEMWNYDQPEDF